MGIGAQSKKITAEIKGEKTISLDYLTGQFYRASQIITQNQDEKIHVPIIIYAGEDPSFMGVLAPVLRNGQNELQKMIYECIRQGVFSMGGGKFAAVDETEFAEFQTIKPESKKALEEKIRKKLNIAELACFEFVFLEKNQPTWQKPVYSVAELAALTDRTDHDIKMLAMRFPVLNKKRIKIEGKTYYRHSAIEYVMNPEIEHEKIRSEIIKILSTHPYMTAERWDFLKKQNNAKTLDSRQIINLFSKSWDEIMKTCSRRKPAKNNARNLTKEQVIEYGKKYAARYGDGPKESVWKKDQYFPDIKEVRRHFKTFNDFREKLGYKKIESKNRKLTSEQKTRIKRLALKGAIPKSIENRVGLELKQVKTELARQGIIDLKTIKKDMSTLSAVKNYQHNGIVLYQKTNIRDTMLEKMIEVLGNKGEIRYLGLEGPNFRSYIRIAELANIIPHESLIPEWNDRTYFAMRSIVKNWCHIQGGEIFKKLRIYYGELSKAVKEKNGKYNFLNLDYQGPLNQEKLQAMHDMFALNRLQDKAVVFITLNNSDLIKSRLRQGSTSLGMFHSDGFPTTNQEVLVHYYLAEFARNYGYNLQEIDSKEYQCRETPMIFLSFEVEKQA